MAIVTMKALLETGVHFGHRTRKWNPKMKEYIFTERNGIHILDLQQTLEAINEVYALIRDEVAQGGSILFVGTKRQAQETIEVEATRCGMPYVNFRWLGGTLTNWSTIRARIDKLDELERRRDRGEFERLTKREALSMQRQIDKLEGRLGGIRNMKKLPDFLFAVDVRREETAIHEANLLEIPVIALVDTNCDPGAVDYVIPSNDDAIRAIKLLTSLMANAVLEGKALRKEEEEEAPTESAAQAPAEEMTDEELLGEATLAKLESGAYDEKGEEAEAEAAEESAEDADVKEVAAEEPAAEDVDQAPEETADEEKGAEEAADEASEETEDKAAKKPADAEDVEE